jgi:hypothetical protein
MPWQPSYVTADDLKQYLRIDDTADDLNITLAISTASRLIDRATHRQFGQTDALEARVYTAQWDPFTVYGTWYGQWYIDCDDLTDVTGLVVTSPTGPIDHFRFEPGNAVSKGMAYTRLVVKNESTAKPDGFEDTVTITAKWGWSTVPDTIKQATLIQASRIHIRRDSPFGVAGSPDLGNEMRLLAKLDPDVAVMVAAYRRPMRPA